MSKELLLWILGTLAACVLVVGFIIVEAHYQEEMYNWIHSPWAIDKYILNHKENWNGHAEIWKGTVNSTANSTAVSR